MKDYRDFLKEKDVYCQSSGFEVDVDDLNPMLFDWQKVLVKWALFRGRAAIFASCGLGKTPMQLQWALKIYEKTGKDILILAPLAVSHQTKREGDKFGIPVNICKTDDDVKPGINITNYERMHYFDPSLFIGVVADESGILKSFASKTRTQIIETFRDTPYKLCCTATPSPNDYTELGNTAEFLGVMTRAEMLSMFFINDSGDTTANWRLKGHVKDNLFWKWLASWSVMLQFPSDIGFDDNGFILPPLNTEEIKIPYKGPKTSLFVTEARTLTDRRNARKESLKDRVAKTAELVNKSNDIWLVWCNLNMEADALKKAIPDSVEVRGSDKPEFKENAMWDFAKGNIRCLVSKPSIAGFGMNFQVCHNMAFVGLSDSWEQYYQAVRRCWRFGQDHPVNVYIIIGEREGAVLANIKRKEVDMQNMYEGMKRYMKRFTEQELLKTERVVEEYNPTIEMELPEFVEV